MLGAEMDRLARVAAAATQRATHAEATALNARLEASQVLYILSPSLSQVKLNKSFHPPRPTFRCCHVSPTFCSWLVCAHTRD